MAIRVPADLPVHPLTGALWDRMAERGLFAPDEKVELLEGVPVEMSPQGARHAAIVQFLTDLWGGGPASLRPQLPLAPSGRSRPAPDIALVPRGSYGAHPVTALLLVEISVSSHAVDRGIKAEIYAGAGVPEYWVLDAPGERLEVRTEPGVAGYGRLETLGAGAVAQPQAVGVAPLGLDALFAAVRGIPDTD